ncbi:tetratricopeptide repeat protein [Agromyces cerinus]|uniref:Tetratrico peptide repeat-containing protein n=1 Tax=Agromyces cerinus subsp. cerinus TaxID=232089 RepID=A0A1N6ET28_9MICO|nr:tetratricopeptide repeat protein [Agromyces cerinus]SIN86252.1 Tetratrico peptide repeat-containing protein [Agromyces cerinus subsp. cerinus]
MTATLSSELDATLREIFERRDRANMQPTIDEFLAVLADHPGDPYVLYEVGGSYDTAGEEETALGYYERALGSGLGGDPLRRCLLQYGSTLRILGRMDDSLAALDRALAEYPDSESVRLFHALGLHAAGRSDAAVGELLAFAADAVRTPDVLRYEAALRGNAGYLLGLDEARTTA